MLNNSKKPIHHSDNETMNSDILLAVLLDRSGSMMGKESDVIGNFNKFIKDQKKLPGTAKLTLILFDDMYEILYDNVNLKEVKPLTNETYWVRGSTALLDAFGRLIKSVDKIKNKPEKILFLINTDGFENASREFTRAQIKELVTERQENHDWQFLFIGAGVDAFTEASSLGLGSWQTFSGSATSAGLTNISNYSSSLASVYRTTGATGQTLNSMALGVTEFVDDPDAPLTVGNTADKQIKKRGKKVKNTASNP